MYKFNSSLSAQEAKPVGFVCVLWNGGAFANILVRMKESEVKEILSKDGESSRRYIMDGGSCNGEIIEIIFLTCGTFIVF